MLGIKHNMKRLTITNKNYILKKSEKQTIVITDDVHLYNSNVCNYKLTNKD
ncbi:MAG: hypothetical protein RR359_03470 [Bacilli bacterium]